MEKYYVYAEGGLGDIFHYYFRKSGFRFLPSFKAANPDAYVRLILTSQNSAAPDFFRFHPFIDDIAYSPHLGKLPRFRRRNKEGFYAFEGRDQSGTEYAAKQPLLYLSELERRMVDRIKAAGRYVAWHPWGGTEHRNFNNVFDLAKMSDTILAQGWNLVLVGGQSPKISRRLHYPKDRLPVEKNGRAGVFDLVPFNNVRVCSALVAEATRFIGTDSCFAVMAALHGVTALVMTNNNHWTEGCPLLIKNGPTSIIHFDVWRRGEACLGEVISAFCS
jgi:hypothetical protein